MDIQWMVCWWVLVQCGWPGFQVEDDPENVESLSPPEINLCALEEPTNATVCLLCLPKLTTSEYLDACFD
jgi:hypothetical protein